MVVAVGEENIGPAVQAANRMLISQQRGWGLIL
jgi:hypothetical protein